MADTFDEYVPGLTSPVEEDFDITPNDSVDLAETTRKIYIDSAGVLVVILKNNIGSTTYSSLLAGMWHHMRVKRVLATGTTATGIKGGI